jgi:hypothetical protein
MTVAHLIKLLQQEPDNFEVIINVSDDEQLELKPDNEDDGRQVVSDPMNGFTYIEARRQS